MEESKQTFDEFLEVVRRVVENSDDLVAMLQRRYTGTNPHFLWNREFVSTVRECQQHILNNKDKSYVYLAQFNKTLKEYATKPLKHLLGKNGTCKTPELDDDVRCEVLLNSLAKQQKQSSVIKNSSPPLKRQRLLGVNKDNEVIIVEDQPPTSGPTMTCLLPIKPLSPVHSEEIVSCYGMPGKVGVTAPANSCVVGTDVAEKSTTVQKNNQQPCSNQVNEVICIDDDEDDVLVVTYSPKADSSASVPLASDKKDEPQSGVQSTQTASANTVAPESPVYKVSVESSSTDLHSNNDPAAACISIDDTGDSEQFPTASEQVTDSRSLAQSSVDGQQHAASAAANVHHSPSSRKVARLEHLLKKLSNRIKKLQESELTLEDMDSEDTNFVLEEKFTRKFMKVWEKLCQIKNRPTSTGRATEQKFVCELQRYPEIADKISLFVNKHKCFPDYEDILNIVRDYSSGAHADSLGHSTVDTLAREIFAEVGNKLQQRRMKDFMQNFGSHLTDEYRPSQDPALIDNELQKQLVENRKTGRKKLDEVIDKFVQRQEQAGDHTDDGGDDDDDDDDDVEPNDSGNSDSDDVDKAASDAGDGALAGEAVKQGVDDVGYEWSVNISSSESEDDATVKKGNGSSSKTDSTNQTQCNTVDTTVLLIDDDDDDGR